MQHLMDLSKYILCQGFPGDSNGKEPACDAGDPGSIPESGSSPGEGNSNNPLQYSCLGNPMDWGAWRPTVHGVAKGQTPLSVWHFLPSLYSCQGTGLDHHTRKFPHALFQSDPFPHFTKVSVLSFSPSNNLIWNLVSTASGSVFSAGQSFPSALCLRVTHVVVVHRVDVFPFFLLQTVSRVGRLWIELRWAFLCKSF